jgi:hypothetical protein
MCKRFFYLGFTLALFWSSAFVLSQEPAAKADHSWLNGTWEGAPPEAERCKWNSKWLTATTLKDQAT